MLEVSQPAILAQTSFVAPTAAAAQTNNLGEEQPQRKSKKRSYRQRDDYLTRGYSETNPLGGAQAQDSSPQRRKRRRQASPPEETTDTSSSDYGSEGENIRILARRQSYNDLIEESSRMRRLCRKLEAKATLVEHNMTTTHFRAHFSTLTAQTTQGRSYEELMEEAKLLKQRCRQLNNAAIKASRRLNIMTRTESRSADDRLQAVVEGNRRRSRKRARCSRREPSESYDDDDDVLEPPRKKARRTATLTVAPSRSNVARRYAAPSRGKLKFSSVMLHKV